MQKLEKEVFYHYQEICQTTDRIAGSLSTQSGNLAKSSASLVKAARTDTSQHFGGAVTVVTRGPSSLQGMACEEG
jgi:hypothetical protein